MSLILFGIVLPWVVVGFGCWLGFQLLQQNGRMLLHLERLEQQLARRLEAPRREPAAPQGLPVGSPAPAFELPALEGGRKSLADFRGRKLLLIFFNPRCGFCTRMVPDLAALPVDGVNGKPVPLLVTSGDPDENRKLVQEHGLRLPVLLQAGMEVGAQYACHGTPMGYLIDEEGRIASEQAVGAPTLLELASGTAPLPTNGNGHAPLGGKRSLADSKLQRNGLAPGTPAPDFRLPRLDGGELSLSEYRGRKLLLVFSDPNCGPCDQLAHELERQYRAGAPVLMVSRGDEAANRAKIAEHGLTFPAVLQQQWEISRDYGIFATPVGYLIDENGLIEAAVATGVEPILALLARAAAPVNGMAPSEPCPCGKAGRKEAARAH